MTPYLQANLLISTLALFLGTYTSVFAQPVTVQGSAEFGHGMLLKHNSTCYLLTPKHVIGGGRSVTVFSPAPVVHSRARVETPFWAGMDFAIGVVRGPVEKHCRITLADLTSPGSIAAGRTAQLLRLRPSGEIEQIDMSITRSDYLTLDARIESNSHELFKGTSGTFLFLDEKPIGMVVQALSETEGRFIRIEEIHMNLSRFLNQRAGFQTAQQTARLPPADEVQSGVPIEFVSASQPPISPAFSEQNMLGKGSYVFHLPRPNRIAFKVAGRDVATISRVQISSGREASYAPPRSIRIDVSSTPDGGRPRFFGAGEMGPDGIFDFSRAPTTARWIFVTIGDSWNAGPIGINQITIQ